MNDQSQVDKLGERLKGGNYSDDDLRLLDEYRESFTESYHSVVRTVLEHVGIEPTGRRIKSTQSIIAKLQRQSTKLSQIQDIAGCRITVEDINQQNKAVEKIVSIFAGAIVIDRRERPSHGYRAVHIITSSERRVEIQIRTRLQHLWAQLSEKLSDVIDPMIKYGAGPDLACQMLSGSSKLTAFIESLEIGVPLEKRLEAADTLRDLRQNVADYLHYAGMLLMERKKDDDFPN